MHVSFHIVKGSLPRTICPIGSSGEEVWNERLSLLQLHRDRRGNVTGPVGRSWRGGPDSSPGESLRCELIAWGFSHIIIQ